MNTKFFFALVLMALLAAACAPIVAGGAVPMDPAQPKDYVPSAPIAARSDSQESRLWSGPVSISDTNSPDYVQPIQAPAVQNSQSECVSEDSLPRRHGGCVE